MTLRSTRMLVAAAISCVSSVLDVSRADPAQPDPGVVELSPTRPGYAFDETLFVEFPRRYRDMEPAEVLKAARGGRRMDVRFKDTVRNILPQEGFLGPRIGFQIYPVGVRFETASGITVAVPHLHYTPWLDEPLARARALQAGQEVIVEGIVEGRLWNRFVVFSDRIVTPEEHKSEVSFELKCGWPDAADAPSLNCTKPGRYELIVPGSREKVTVSVERKSAEEVRSLLKAIRFGPDAKRPHAHQYEKIGLPALADRKEGTNVRLTERVQAVAVPDGNDTLITTSTGATIPIEVCLRLDSGARCLIPRADATLIERASRYYPGFHVEAEGTIVMNASGEPCLLVDDFCQAGFKGVVESIPAWLVQVSRPGASTQVFASPGTYEISIPVGADKTELLRMTMRQLRHLETRRQP